MSRFFKNEWFRCIVTLLALAVLSSGILAILSDVLYVSPEERTMRAVKKIYGEEKEISIIYVDIDSTDEKINSAITYENVGSINKLYEIKNADNTSDLLFQTTGFNGYKGGTVTLWSQVKSNGDKYEIVKVMLESFDKQTLMSKLGGEFYGKFELKDITEAYQNGHLFTPSDSSAPNYNPVSGATYSATAGNNAVNCVLNYIGGLSK